MVRFRKPKRTPATVRDEVAARVTVIPTGELTMWLDTTVSATGTAVTLWGRATDPLQLHEAEIAAETSLAIVRELLRRTVTT